jgi:hypothetical protein
VEVAVKYALLFVSGLRPALALAAVLSTLGALSALGVGQRHRGVEPAPVPAKLVSANA